MKNYINVNSKLERKINEMKFVCRDAACRVLATNVHRHCWLYPHFLLEENKITPRRKFNFSLTKKYFSLDENLHASRRKQRSLNQISNFFNQNI